MHFCYNKNMLELNKIDHWRSNRLPFFLKAETGSTNVDCRVYAEEYDGDFIFLAEKQNAGRGRRGRDFYSPDHGFYFSMCVNAVSGKEILYTLVCAVAAAEALEGCGQKTEIKWVNDLYQNGKKAAGILCEAIRSNEDFTLKKVIIGIGINVSEDPFPEELKDKAVRLGGIDRNQLAGLLSDALLKWLGAPEEEVLREYRHRSFLIGREVLYEINGREKSGRVTDINEKGNLVVLTEEGEDVLASGEISLKNWK